jgi:hypothetical protein
MGKNQGQTRGQRADNASAAGGQMLSPEDRKIADSRPSAEEMAKRKPKEYRALARGYVDGMIREPGEVFATAAEQGSWMEPLSKGKDARVSAAVDDTMASKKDDPDLTTFSMEALQAEALRLGLTDATGLSKDDLIVAIRAAYVNEAQ